MSVPLTISLVNKEEESGEHEDEGSDDDVRDTQEITFPAEPGCRRQDEQLSTTECANIVV